MLSMNNLNLELVDLVLNTRYATFWWGCHILQPVALKHSFCLKGDNFRVRKISLILRSYAKTAKYLATKTFWARNFYLVKWWMQSVHSCETQLIQCTFPNTDTNHGSIDQLSSKYHSWSRLVISRFWQLADYDI